jgi:tRNA pseudouridine38-40 synthase
VTHLCVSRSGPYIVLDIKANAFLHHMVRNITGSLLLVGQGTSRWVDCRGAGSPGSQPGGPDCQGGGLYLVDVDYPAELGLPRMPLGSLWLPDSAPGTTSF